MPRDVRTLTTAIDAVAAIEPAIARAVEVAGYPSPRVRDRGHKTLLRTIVGQQVSVAAASSMWGKLEDLLGEEMAAATIDDRLAGSYPFLDMAATAVAAWQLLRQSRWLDANAAGTPQAKAKHVVARYFESALVTEALGLAAQVRAGATLLYALDAEALAG